MMYAITKYKKRWCLIDLMTGFFIFPKQNTRKAVKELHKKYNNL